MFVLNASRDQQPWAQPPPPTLRVSLLHSTYLFSLPHTPPSLCTFLFLQIEPCQEGMGSDVTLYIFILGHRGGLLPLLFSLPEQANPIRAHAASMQLAWGEICRGLLRVPGKTASCSILQPYSPGLQLRSRHPGCSPPQQRRRPQAWALKLSPCSKTKNSSFFFCYPPNLSSNLSKWVRRRQSWSFMFDLHTNKFSGSAGCSQEDDFCS